MDTKIKFISTAEAIVNTIIRNYSHTWDEKRKKFWQKQLDRAKKISAKLPTNKK